MGLELLGMMKRYRKALLFLALAGVVALAIFAPAPEEPLAPVKGEPKAAVRADASPAARKAANEKSSGARLNEIPDRNGLGNAKADLFGTRSWLPPPPPPKPVALSAEVPAPPPPPPPQTYRFAGRLVQDNKVQFFVSKGDTPIPVTLGSNLDGYVVESIAADRIALVYPPLGSKESIVVPPAIPGDAPAVPVGLGSLPVAPPALVVPPKPLGGLARVQWQGPAQVKQGANFMVALRVVADQVISSSPMQVKFDPALLESVAVRPGKRYGADAGQGFNYKLNPDGRIVINASAKTAAGNDPELLVLTFRAKKKGAQAEVSLTQLQLLGAEGRPLAHDTLASYRTSVLN
jgi:hypothetical protein